MTGTPAPAQAPTIETDIFTDSSYVSGIQYDPSGLVLTVNFRYGGVRQFRPVYPQTVMDFRLSPSKGSFFHQAIRSTMGEGMRIK